MLSVRNEDRELISSLAGIHQGRTVFVVGAGPGLIALRARHIQGITSCPSIGVNMTPYLVPVGYFVSSYLPFCVWAQMEYRRRGISGTILKLVTNNKRELDHDIWPVRKRLFQGELESNSDFLRTKKNVILACIHLAYLMGAGRIVLVGVEMNTADHFYNLLPAMHGRIVGDIQRSFRSPVSFLRRATGRKWDRTEDKFIRQVRLRPKSNRQMDWGKDKVFSSYVEILNKNNVEVVSTNRNSLPVRCGAKFIPLRTILKQEGVW